MFGDIPPVILIPLTGVAIGLVVAVVLPPFSKHRNAKRARDSGAVWVGLANLDGMDREQAPVVANALSEVGALYGSFFSPVARGQRPVGGLLSILGDELRWEPRIWLSRGHASSWRLPRSQVTGIEIGRVGINSFRATLQTAGGPIRLMVVDPGGLRTALGFP